MLLLCLVIQRVMRITPLGLRDIVNENPLNLEMRTSSVLSVLLLISVYYIQGYPMFKHELNNKDQGFNARKVKCGCVYSAYKLKPVLSGRNL